MCYNKSIENNNLYQQKQPEEKKKRKNDNKIFEHFNINHNFCHS